MDEVHGTRRACWYEAQVKEQRYLWQVGWAYFFPVLTQLTSGADQSVLYQLNSRDMKFRGGY